MKNKAEASVLNFFLEIDFPGIRFGEGNKIVCDYLKSQGYNSTPDLVAGPANIEEACIEGLFFIDVIKPTSDLLFKSIATSKQVGVNVPEIFEKILQNNTIENKSTKINMLPKIHHKCYLDVLNIKLDKYSHKRKFTCDGQSMVTANSGIVHHFNLGDLDSNNISSTKDLITLIDYIRFYKDIAPSENVDNIDIRNSENLIFQEILNIKSGISKKTTPYILSVGREWSDIPFLFLVIHIEVKKDDKIHNLALLVINTFFLDNSDMVHPVHKWFANKILHPLSKKFRNDEFLPEAVTITIDKGIKLFS